MNGVDKRATSPCTFHQTMSVSFPNFVSLGGHPDNLRTEMSITTTERFY
ncbi:hypothetical protein CAURIC_09515 [Corynebacterium auriscanis]|nr:hypothetical protein CAURIC_09515 [Corynebacterium auriscanis]